jgi:hypothetical protein
LSASLGSVTDTSNYKWGCAYANEFLAAVEDLDVEKLTTIAQKAIGLYGGGDITLPGRLRCELRLVITKVRLVPKMRHLGVAAVLRGVRTVPRLCVLCPGIRLKTEKKSERKKRQSG